MFTPWDADVIVVPGVVIPDVRVNGVTVGKVTANVGEPSKASRAVRGTRTRAKRRGVFIGENGTDV
jgi:hypothetical protein